MLPVQTMLPQHRHLPHLLLFHLQNAPSRRYPDIPGAKEHCLTSDDIFSHNLRLKTPHPVRGRAPGRRLENEFLITFYHQAQDTAG